MMCDWYRMKFDPETDRWVVKIRGSTYGLHCGEYLEIRVGDEGIPCRLECCGDWSVDMEEVRFDLRRKDCYDIRLG